MSLNDKRQEVEPDDYVYPEDDVKEFIKKLKGMIDFELKPVTLGKSMANRLNSQVDILAGEGLI